MTRKRASLADRPKRETGKGVDAFFEATPKPEPKPEEVRKTATFNLSLQRQDYLDEFVKAGKQKFRREGKVGVGSINKSAVLEQLLDKLQGDKGLQQELLKRLEQKGKEEGSRHDPRKAG